MNYKGEIDNSLKNLKYIAIYKRRKLIMAADNISRSTSWNDKITNHMRKKVEEFIPSKKLDVINEENRRTIFENSRGKSNIDLTITNNQMLAN